MNQAQKYLSLGFSVIPLGSVSKDAAGKKVIEYPASGWKKYQTALPTPEEASSWNGNLGIVTGRVSNLLVLDIDSYKPGFDPDLVASFGLPPTPCQETASGGKQYFFRYPHTIELKNAVCIGHEGSGIDIRGDGGMVIAPPTKTPYGAYNWILDPEETSIADIPPALLTLLEKEHSSEAHAPKSLLELSNLKEGEGRDNALASICGTLAASLHPSRWPMEIFPALIAINNTYKPPLHQRDIKRIYESITKKEAVRRRALPPQTAPIPPKKEITVEAPMSFGELMTAEYPAARYVLEPYFETGTLNMISAPPNTWKSWLLFYIASHIAKGTVCMDKFKTEKSNVLIVNEEDSPRSIQERFRMLGIKDKKLPIFFHIAKGLKVDEVLVEKIVAQCKEHDIKVVMFDSLRSVHFANENDSTEMQVVLDHLKAISRAGITVIFTHHNRKKGPFDKADSAELSRGSTAINAAISGHVSLEEEVRDGTKFVIMRHLKSKAGKKEDAMELEIENDEEDKVTFVWKGKFKESEKKANQAKSYVTNELRKGKWVTVKELAAMKIAGESNIREALGMLGKEKLLLIKTRGQAERDGTVAVGGGKANEVLYSLDIEKAGPDELDEFGK